MRDGYDPKFLGNEYEIPLPTPSLKIQDDILEIPHLESSPILNYIHFSLCMSKSNKQAFFSAANFDRSQYHSVKNPSWHTEKNISVENQITNTFYEHNVWDRGHITRRSAITWGNDAEAAKTAGDSSMVYTNAALQHKKFNQDEWRIIESVADDAEYVQNQKMSIFTGPIFTQTDRWYTRRRTGEKVRIPSGFWKLIVYVHAQTKKLLTQGFVLFQDDEAMFDHKGRKFYESRNFQVTTTEIEMYSGFKFPKILFDTNPLYFYPHEQINTQPEGLGIPPDIKEKDFKKYLAIREKETITTLRDNQRNLSGEGFATIMDMLDQ